MTYRPRSCSSYLLYLFPFAFFFPWLEQQLLFSPFFMLKCLFHILSFFAETVVLRHSEKNRGLGLCLNLILSQIISSLRVSAASYHQSHIFITQPRMSRTGVTEYVLACIERAHVSPREQGEDSQPSQKTQLLLLPSLFSRV